jgi:hypothetical protein
MWNIAHMLNAYSWDLKFASFIECQ